MWQVTFVEGTGTQKLAPNIGWGAYGCICDMQGGSEVLHRPGACRLGQAEVEDATMEAAITRVF